MPISPPTSNPTPIPTRPVTPCSRSEHLPGLSRPIASSPPSQQLNDPGERDPQPHRVDVDAGPLVGTPSDSSPTHMPSPLPTHPLPPPDPFPVPLPLPPIPPPAQSLLPSNLSPTFSPSPLPSPLIPPSVHSPLPPDSLLVPSPRTPLPARRPPLSDLPPTSSPPPPMPLPTHSPPPTDPPLHPPHSPTPVHPLLPSGLLLTSLPPLLLFVRPPSSPPPPSLLLASPEQVANPALMSYRNLPSHLTLPTDRRSSCLPQLGHSVGNPWVTRPLPAPTPTKNPYPGSWVRVPAAAGMGTGGLRRYGKPVRVGPAGQHMTGVVRAALNVFA
ncbi:hypothetical protein EDB84DRAFT_1606730 [Lactarius hengduanensis]|nr:hypothetical protein EDB84DRAFT_1606730 [Lactarius hengduanensis]